MDIKNFEIATWAYIENFIKPNLTSDIDKWIMYLGLGFGTLAFQKKITQLMPLGKQLGVINQNNQIDLVSLQKYARFAFQKQPKVKIWKLTFCQNDFNDYITCLKKGNITPPPNSDTTQNNEP